MMTSAPPKVRVEWAFLCEDVSLGPSGEPVSIHGIIRPHTGLGVRSLPWNTVLHVLLALSGAPHSRHFVTVDVSDGTPAYRHQHTYPFHVPASGIAELDHRIGPLQFLEPNTYTFTVRLDSDVVLSVKAGLEQAIGRE